MIRIAIVDDDEKLCSKIEQSLIAYRETTAIELDIELFYSGESFYHFLGGTSASEVTNESCAASELVKRVASDVMARTEKE